MVFLCTGGHLLTCWIQLQVRRSDCLSIAPQLFADSRITCRRLVCCCCHCPLFLSLQVWLRCCNHCCHPPRRSLSVLVYSDFGGAACPPQSTLHTMEQCSASVPGSCSSTCADGVRDEGESGIDCGGTSDCGPCGAGQACNSNSDCSGALTCSVTSVCMCTSFSPPPAHCVFPVH